MTYLKNPDDAIDATGETTNMGGNVGEKGGTRLASFFADK